MCVQDFDVQCVLQFTLVNAAGCALHRHTSLVIHRIEWSFIPSNDKRAGARHQVARFTAPSHGETPTAGSHQCSYLNLAMP